MNATNLLKDRIEELKLSIKQYESYEDKILNKFAELKDEELEWLENELLPKLEEQYENDNNKR